MPMLNAYTTVSHERTVDEIQRLLRTFRTKKVLIEYDESGNACSVAFQMATPLGDREFALPCRWEPVHARLLTDPPQSSGKLRFPKSEAHARNVAWRVVKDWLEAQLTIIESGMVAADEVFMPYMITSPGKTLYEGFTQQRLMVKEQERNQDG